MLSTIWDRLNPIPVVHSVRNATLQTWLIRSHSYLQFLRKLKGAARDQQDLLESNPFFLSSSTCEFYKYCKSCLSLSSPRVFCRFFSLHLPFETVFKEFIRSLEQNIKEPAMQLNITSHPLCKAYRS